jgi:hypothetical protein
MGSETTVEGQKTYELRRDIASTENEMSETIHEIQRRLSPRYIIDQTKESVRRTGVSTSQKFITKVKENPIPAAMAGIGLWLLMRDNGHGGDGYDTREMSDFRRFDYEEPSKVDRLKSKASDAIDEAREKVSDLAGTTKEKAADLAESTRETASHVAEAARRKAFQARQQSRDLLRDSPLVAGLAALALGAMVAAVIPETEKENEMLGETRDELLDRGKDLAREGMDKAKRVVSVATEIAKNEVRA